MSENQIPSWMSEEAVKVLSRGYLYKDESPRGMYERLAHTAAKLLNFPTIEEDLFDILWKGYLGPASPVASNFGTPRGLPVSCFGVNVSDSIVSIYSHLKEVASLSKHGGGVGAYFGNIRPTGAPIAGGGVSNGVHSWMKQYDFCASVVSQGGVRRGSFAMYVDIDSPDLLKILRAKDHSQGDPRDFIDSNIAVVVKDEWMESMLAGDPHKKDIFCEILRTRMISGSPYFTFVDNINRANPPGYVQRGLKVSHSQLCNEITLYSDENHTYTCVLSSINADKYPEWKNYRGKNTGLTVPQLSVYFLDAVNQEFINKASRLPSMGRAVRFATKSRALGLGIMGLHSLYQRESIPFESSEARRLNIEIHELIKVEAVRASKEMATKYGEPEWCKGTGMRHTHLLAIAPTKTNSVIASAGSEGIEPIEGNYYGADGAKGSFARKNKYLEQVLESIGKNTEEVWKDILVKRGSVQHLDFLTPHQKEVFKTAREITPMELVIQAVQRQKFVCQGQSLNLFVDAKISAKDLIHLHVMAWKGGLKGLYYLKSNSLVVDRTRATKDKPASAPVVKIVTKPGCPYCVLAKDLLRDSGFAYTEVDLADVDKSTWTYSTVPQIWIDEHHVGGYSELNAMFGQEDKYSSCASCEA